MGSRSETGTGRQGTKSSDQAGIRGVEFQPDFNIIQACLVENIVLYVRTIPTPCISDRTQLVN